MKRWLGRQKLDRQARARRSRCYFIRRLPEDLQRSALALITLSGFGRGFGHAPIGVWSSQADPDLLLDLRSVSKALDLPTRHVQLKKYPAVDLASIGTDTVPSAFLFVADPDIGGLAGEYLDSFRFLAVYLGYVDQTMEARGKPIPLDNLPPLDPPDSDVALGAREGADDEGEGADGADEEDVGEHQGGEDDRLGAADAVTGEDGDQRSVPGAGAGD